MGDRVQRGNGNCLRAVTSWLKIARIAIIAKIVKIPDFSAGYNAAKLSLQGGNLSGTLAALQLLAAFFLAILGLGMVFRRDASVIGAFLAALGLSFLALLRINLRRHN